MASHCGLARLGKRGRRRPRRVQTSSGRPTTRPTWLSWRTARARVRTMRAPTSCLLYTSPSPRD
eukprot:3572338-Alexandrium_andersonii.AAC.1